MTLKREIGVFGATMMGLGSIIGTGVFVSIGIAAGIAGSAVIIAIAIAAIVAVCNALSSAQLAANHPVSGGTYEYGYRYLKPILGFAAGWMFLCAKSASAATAALGFAGYFLNATGIDAKYLVPIAFGVVVVLTLIVCGGLRLSSRINILIVSITLLSLATFVTVGASSISTNRLAMTIEPTSLMNAAALMFVAYTGYGRIATLGEEVIEPRRTIPRAITLTLMISMLIYGAVTVVAVGTVGADQLSAATTSRAAPLEIVSHGFPWKIHGLVAIGAMTAMLGVLLNLLLGLSRVFLAMARRDDMPNYLNRLPFAILTTGAIIAALVLIGSVKTTWTFSAFTVLIYYAVTNLAALQLKKEDQLYPPILAVVGLIACLCLAFSIERNVWLSGLGILAIGLLWFEMRKSFPRREAT